MITGAAFLTALFLVSQTNAPTAAPPDGPPVMVEFKNAYGNVTFDHEEHKSFRCGRCHPPFDFGYKPGSGYSQRAHGQCIECHAEGGKGTSCASCHQVKKRTEIPFRADNLKAGMAKDQQALDFLAKRRSVRKFKEDPVPEEAVRDILKAAMSAPSAGNWQPWEFVVVTDSKDREKLSQASPFAKQAKSAPVIFVIAGRRDNEWAAFDCAMAAENLLLAAANMGYGGTYCGIDEERGRGVAAILGIPFERYRVFALIPIGVPAEALPPHTKYDPGKVHFGKFKDTGRETVVR